MSYGNKRANRQVETKRFWLTAERELNDKRK
jgi:hypothetical protein